MMPPPAPTDGLSSNMNLKSMEPPRHRANSYEASNKKRFRTGSISGRLRYDRSAVVFFKTFLIILNRTASDLEDLGFIDKKQKGLIKDLIISGDKTLEEMLDKYEKGEGKELLGILLYTETNLSYSLFLFPSIELINQGYLGRNASIDLLEGLDFDFLNGLRDDQDTAGTNEFENFDFAWNEAHEGKENPNNHLNNNNHNNNLNNNNNNSHGYAGHLHSSGIGGNYPTTHQQSFVPPLNGVPQLANPGNVHSHSLFQKNRTFSEVVMDSMDKRKGSFDALMISDMIFDDPSALAHSAGGEGPDLGLFDESYLPGGGSGGEGSSPRHRRSLRFDSLTETLLSPELSPRDIDLSAYAGFAQTLQNSKSTINNNNNKSRQDSSKLVRK
jgi:hypothetical protein